VQQIGMRAQQPQHGFAIVTVNGLLQKPCGCVRVDPLLQLRPTGKSILPRDDQLRIIQEKFARRDRRVIRLAESRMSPSNAIERFG
jgi:hypothetical protein